MKSKTYQKSICMKYFEPPEKAINKRKKYERGNPIKIKI